MAPTRSPTEAPANTPTKSTNSAKPETSAPTGSPTKESTSNPTKAPTESPTQDPTNSPTKAPTESPTKAPTERPTTEPTESPTTAPTESPTTEPTESPTKAPTMRPTKELSVPSVYDNNDSKGTSNDYTPAPTNLSSTSPSAYPSAIPSPFPFASPSVFPSATPSSSPSKSPSSSPSTLPTNQNTIIQETTNTAPTPCTQLSQNQTPNSSILATLSIQYELLTKNDVTQSQEFMQSLQNDMKYELSSAMLKCNTANRQLLRSLQVIGVDDYSPTELSNCLDSTSQINYSFCNIVSQELIIYLQEDTPVENRFSIVTDALSDIQSTFENGELNDENDQFEVIYVTGSVMNIDGVNVADVQDKEGLKLDSIEDENNVIAASRTQGNQLNSNGNSGGGAVVPAATAGIAVASAVIAFIIAGLVFRKKQSQPEKSMVPLKDDDIIEKKPNGNQEKKTYESRVDPSWAAQMSSSNLSIPSIPLDGEYIIDQDTEDLNTTTPSTPGSSPFQVISQTHGRADLANMINEDHGYYISNTSLTTDGEEDIEISFSEFSQPSFVTTNVHECTSSSCSICRNCGAHKPTFYPIEIEPPSDPSGFSSREIPHARPNVTNDTIIF
uniref:Uncharacterized protein n=1 Tax=Ditylum brightwellii TaxID=49249 RepID=A0A7S4VIR2_9STRA